MGRREGVVRKRAGFTIVEILIAVVVISLALVGILAMLTASTKLAGEVVEDSYAATLARSIYESLREGARKRAFAVQDGNKTVRGFLFIHEGVKNDGFSPADVANCTPPPLPNNLATLNAARKSDFAIFLPTPVATGTATTSDPFFVYPRPGTSLSDVQTENTNNADDFYPAAMPGYLSNNSVFFKVKRVYSLRDRVTSGATTTGTNPGPAEQADQYGFSIFIRRAKAPPLKSDAIPAQSDGMVPVDGLYEVRVNIYRNFEPEERSRTHEPLPGGQFVELMAIGY